MNKNSPFLRGWNTPNWQNAQKNVRKNLHVCEHFLTKISIIILVTPPIHYIVFLLHPISNKKIPSPERDSRSVGCLFYVLATRHASMNKMWSVRACSWQTTFLFVLIWRQPRLSDGVTRYVPCSIFLYML